MKTTKDFYNKFETGFPPAFPWDNTHNEDKPRFVFGEDGYWFNPESRESGKALISLTGDLMCEPDMCRKNRYGDTWFFHGCFQYVRKIFRESDFVAGNLETTVTDLTPYAGEYHVIPRGDRLKYHCNAPESYLDSVRYAGYDALVNANNHNCDSGTLGLKETLERMDNHGFMRTGTFLPGDERVLLVKVNGIKLAILSYATRFNDMDSTWTEEAKETFLNEYSFEKAKNDVALAGKMGAEFVVSYIHWGVDYQEEPNEQQLSILDELKETGVDYIVGSHTHCLQHYTRVKSSSGKEIPVIFSMGNFVTNEFKELCKHTGILQLSLERCGGEIRFREYFLPCYVFDEMGSGKYTVVPVDSHFGGVDCEKLRSVREYVRQRIGDKLPEPVSSAVTIDELCDCLGVDAPEGSDYTPVSGLCIRPGAAKTGSVYFASGDEDNQDRLRIIKSYASAVVSKEPWDRVANIICDNPLAAYEKVCNHLRGRFDASVVMIGGGYGKTELANKLQYALKSRYSVISQKDWFHTDSAAWMELHPHNDYCVMEIRPDEPTAMLSRIISPKICILSGRTEDTEAYAKDMVSGMDKDGILFYNADDEAVVSAVSKLDVNKKPYTFEGFADVTGISCDALEDFVNKSLQKNVFEFEDISVILDVRAKTEDDIKSAIDKASEKGDFVAVLGAPDLEDADFKDYAIKMGAKQVFEADETELETEVLKALENCSNIVVCGGRKCDLNLFARRIFGITDGYIRNGR